jgi:cytochrome c oxidase subunit II
MSTLWSSPETCDGREVGSVAVMPVERSARWVRTLLIATAILGLGLLAGCGDDDATTSDTGQDGGGDHDEHGDSSDVADDARTVEVTASSFEFDPAEIRVEAGEDVAVALTSDDTLHDFTIDELDAHVAADAGETAEGGFRAEEAGEFTYYCSVDGHREAGMEGTLVVE